MTAEIAIMNKSAIALASDSAVTIGDKIYNTANKLFTLSKYHPVGIMIYGNAEFMGMPWESIIKSYRQKVGTVKFGTLDKQAADFIKFLSKNNTLLPESAQLIYFKETIYSIFNQIRMEIDEEVDAEITCNSKINDLQVSKITDSTIKKKYDVFNKFKQLDTIPQNYAQHIIRKYREVIKEIAKRVFVNHKLSKTANLHLQKICGYCFSKDFRFPGSSGVVIAGYGENDHFPKLIEYNLNAKIDDVLIYKKNQGIKITFQHIAYIVPFAQSEMVSTFMEGIDPYYNKMLTGYLKELLIETLPQAFANNLPTLSKKQRVEIEIILSDIGTNLLQEFNGKATEYKDKYHINPVTQAVSVLPKDELAAMAESLVHITSLKRKFSMAAPETVGGPIDVAVISKGDGFIWIKRKHYFDAQLNPFFSTKYFGKAK